MIKDNKNNFYLYKNINERLNKALEIIANEDFSFKNFGKYEIENEQIYYILTENETKNRKECFFEAHNKYIDIHFCLEGQENISVVNRRELKIVEDYDEEKEALILTGDIKNEIELNKGDFLILFPDDAHMTSIKNKDKKIKKVIFKVLI